MSSTLQQEMLKTNQVFEAAVAARDMAPLDAVYTANARILPPGGEMIAGRDQIKQFWQGAAEGLNVSTVQLVTVDVEQLGDTAYEIGRATLNFATPGAAPVHVKYVVIWKREDGTWKWHIDIWNPNA
jgi:ketosteroid isomerase-like protein